MSEKLQSTIKETILNIKDPATEKTLAETNTIESIEFENDKVIVTANSSGARAAQMQLDALIRTQLSAKNLKIDNLKIKFKVNEKAQEAAKVAQAAGPNPHPLPDAKKLPGVNSIICVASGKGGVGKSTVSINLAFALQKQGKKVGLLDADIYGPSIGQMTGKPGKTNMQLEGDKLVPLEIDGVKMISFAYLIDRAQAIIWRGPMLGKALEQFLFDIIWGELDYLIIDMPPGTGDIQLSLSQLTSVTGSLIVTTPQNVALEDASRAIQMFEKINIPVLGVIENMSEFICPHCGKASQIFSKGGGKTLAKNAKTELFGQIPLNQEIMLSGEGGLPITAPSYKVKDKSTHEIIKAFDEIAKKVTLL